VDNLNAAMRCPFLGNRQAENVLRHVWSRDQRGRNRDERIQEDRAVMIIRAEGWPPGGMGMSLVPRPMFMKGAAAVVLRRVIVRVRMDEWPRQGRSLHRQSQRNGNELPHRYRFILREPPWRRQGLPFPLFPRGRQKRYFAPAPATSRQIPRGPSSTPGDVRDTVDDEGEPLA
jgi:hypothetical protein